MIQSLPKLILGFLMLMWISAESRAQSNTAFEYVETFENLDIAGTSYIDGSFAGNHGITWNYYKSRNESGFSINEKGLLLGSGGEGSAIKSGPISGGISNFKVLMRKAFSSAGDRQIGLYINDELIASSILFGGVSGLSDEILTFEVPNINISGDFTLEIRHLTGTSSTRRQLVIDDISWNAYAGENPVKSPLVLWDFKGEPGNQVFTAGTRSTNISAHDFKRGPALASTAAANSISSSNWSLSEDSYFSFGFDVKEGFAANLENLIIASRSSGTGPGNLALRYSKDGFTSDIATWTQSGINFNNQRIDLSGLADLSGLVEFRIYMTNTTSAGGGTVSSGGTFRVANFLQDGVELPVQFNGTLIELSPPTPVVVANWNFVGQPGNQVSTSGTTQENGIMVADFSRGSGINPASALNSISSNGWNAGDDRFFTFGFNVTPGKLVDLQALQIGFRSSNTGPKDMALRYSGDNFSSDLATWTSANDNLNQTIDLSSLSNLSGNVEFRIISTSDIAVNGSPVASGGTFRITNFFLDNVGTNFVGFVKDAEGVLIPSVSFNTESLDFGLVSLRDAEKILTYELSAVNLTGPVTVIAPAPFSLSKDGNTFSEQVVYTVEEMASTQTLSLKLNNATAGNFALTISHQTAGTSPVQLPVTASVFDPFDIKENFNTSCPDGLPAGWEAYSVSGDQVWGCTTFGRAGTTPTASAPHGLQISGFSDGAARLNEDWLITPTFDLRNFDFPLLSFWSRTAFAGPRLKLLVSTNFEGGDPSLASWTELSDRFAMENVWTFSQEINLANYKGENVRLAFVYNSNLEEGAPRWTLDDFRLRNSETPPAPFLNSSLGNLDYWHFGVVPAGSSSSQIRTFNFSLSDGVDNLSIKGEQGFEFSKNGTDYSSSLVYTAQEAAANNKVSIRFAPTSEGAFTSKIKLQSGDLTIENGFLTGATVNKDETFDVVTWNIEWFGSSTLGPTNVDLQLQNVKTIVEDLDADVYAFQEITEIDKFNELVAKLPGYNGFFSTAVSLGDVETGQKLAFLYKTSTVDSVSTRILLQDVKSEDLVNYPGPTNRFWASGRLPFLFEVKTNINGVQQNINLINIHARSNGGGESAANQRYAMRKYDVDVLKDSLDLYYGDVPLIMLGDYNDDLDETVADQNAPTVNTSETSYIRYINDSANYTPATISLSNARLRTFIAFENVIDHMILSNEMADNWLVNSERIVVPFDLVQNYQNTTSDHLPVKVRFQLKCDLSPGLVTASETEVCAGSNVVELNLIGGVYDNILGWEVSEDNGVTYTLIEGSEGKDILTVVNIETNSLFRTIMDASTCAPINSEPIAVTVVTLPTPTLNFAQGRLLTLIGNYTYNWFKDGQLIETNSTNEIQFRGAGSYQVEITNAEGCSSRSETFSFPPAANKGLYKVYPNPANRKFYVSIQDVLGRHSVELRNPMGMPIKTIITYGEIVEFDVSGLQAGVYLVHITDSQGIVIVERLLVR